MTYLNAALSQNYATADLAAAVRSALGKPLRRSAPLTQLALLGALACLPEEHRQRSTALLWQSTSGPRPETQLLLGEICSGEAEPMPYDFLATQSAIAAAQMQPFLPGLQSATHCPLDQENTAHWSLLLTLADNWLREGRYEQVLCAHLDNWGEQAAGHWLSLSSSPLENSLIQLHIAESKSPEALTDTPDFPARFNHWLEQSPANECHLQFPASSTLAVKFARTKT
jgi:hypothetical protein